MKEIRSSIRNKLMRLVLVTSAVVLFLTGAGVFTYEFIAYKQTAKEQLSTLGEIIAANSTGALSFDDPDDAHEVLQALRAEKHISAGCLYDLNGKLFARYPDSLPESVFPAHPGSYGYRYANNYLRGFQPVKQKEKQVGTLYLSSDIKNLYQRFTLYGIIILIVIIVAFAVAFLISNRLQKSVSKPILELAKTAKNISQVHDYSLRVEKYQDDEVGALTDAFNLMLSRIEQQSTEIKGFAYQLERKVAERTSELEKANNELKRQTEFIETIIESSVDIIAVFDNEFRYVMINRAGVEIYRVAKEKLIGRKIFEVFPQVAESQMFIDLKESFKGEIIHNPYYKSRVTDRVMENFYIPLKDKTDHVYSVLAIGHDINDIVEANEKLKKVNQELELSNKDLEQFAYIASHDLQEPLRKIQTFSELAEKNIEDKNACRKYLVKIISSAERMSELIKAVLNYSRLSSEDSGFEPIDLGELADKIKNDFELIVQEKQAVIDVRKLPVIKGNKLQFHQLFLNLVGNSLKFSDRPPHITISSCMVAGGSNGLENHHSYVELAFRDNGIGFDQKYADKVFSMFQRLHSKAEYPGTGIGLALCKKIVDNHNGKITISSTPGQGSVFKIYLPIEDIVGSAQTS